MPHVFWRMQGGKRRAYGDLRDMGGRRIALKPPGDTRATTDEQVAEKLLSPAIEKLREQQRRRVVDELEPAKGLKEYAAHHLEQKAEAQEATEDHLAETQKRLERAIEFLGADPDIATIEVSDIQRYTSFLRKQPNGRGGTFSGGTVRHYLNALSNLYLRAQSEGARQAGLQPRRGDARQADRSKRGGGVAGGA